MDRDHAAHLRRSAHAGSANRDPAKLERLGWGPCFAQQTSAEAFSDKPSVRVVAVHHNGLQIVGAGIEGLSRRAPTPLWAAGYCWRHAHFVRSVREGINGCALTGREHRRALYSLPVLPTP